MKSRWLGCFAVLFPFLVAGCGSAGGPSGPGTFDNTGGAPPPGSSIGFRSVSLPPLVTASSSTCTGLLGGTRFALLARAAADISVINGDADCTDRLRAILADTFAALTADQAVGIYNLNIGGCVRSYEVARATRDGLVIRPWALLHDTTLGANGQVVCTADAILIVAALVFDGAAGANAMELGFGTINPNYPRNPDVPRF